MDPELWRLGIANCDERIKEIQESFDKSEYKTFSISIVRIEKMIYISLIKDGNHALFPKLLSKYENLMRESYEIMDDRVQKGLTEEGDYLYICKESLGQLEYIKKLCFYGMNR
jgi:hypothetical protein